MAQGHLEFFLCNADDLADPYGVAVQSCFNKYPLTRASDDGSASPIDPVYPGRYYVDPPCREYETDQSKPDGAEDGPVLTARYMLPDGVTCDRCILQMIYCEWSLGSDDVRRWVRSRGSGAETRWTLTRGVRVLWMWDCPADEISRRQATDAAPIDATPPLPYVPLPYILGTQLCSPAPVLYRLDHSTCPW